MKKPEFVEFQDHQTDLSSNLLDSTTSFSEFGDLAAVDTLENKKSVAMKKDKKVFESHTIDQIKAFKELSQFSLSIPLINMIRNPKIEDHEFDPEYLKQFSHHMSALQVEDSYSLHILYIHIIFSQIENFEELQEELGFTEQIQPLNQTIWNSTNIINPHCIQKNLQSLSKDQISEKTLLTEFRISLIEDANQCLVFEKKLMVSKDLVEIAMNSHGHWDIYFAPFLLQRLQSGIIYRYLHIEEETHSLLENYSAIFSQLAKEYSNCQNSIESDWYEVQVKKLINQSFSMAEIEHLVSTGVRHPEVEKLLVGLIGWKEESDRAIKLLNCYYNRNDWQLNDASKPTICQCEERFTINYLIENSKYREKLVICLSAPCFNSKYHSYCFSFHKPKLNEYVADNVSYLWIQNPFGQFKKSGFYDWILYFANVDGKETVSKIIDIKDNKKLGSQLFDKNVLNLRNVKGRYIIHPQNSRQMQIHEVYIDSLSSDEGIYKTPSFSDVFRQIDTLKQNGVDTVYLTGVFERDNEQFGQGYKKPQASSTAYTNRSKPCSMMGGEQEFRRLLQYAKMKGIRVLVDAFCRVSSSHMSKKYQPLRLSYVDQNGRKNYFYGSEGRSINYEDTTILNYRKKDAWDLMLREIEHLIDEYKIDGIHLDNGHVAPQVYELDREELSRVEDNSLMYSSHQIFEGQIVNPKRRAGYWSSKASKHYPNPFFIYLCHNIWLKHPNFIFLSECYESDNSLRFINAIESGFIPRLFKLPKALSQVVGVHMHNNGTLSETEPKSIIKLAKWYEETRRLLPKNAILLQSTSNHIYPYPSYVFKKAAWAVIDLCFFLPEVPITFSKEYTGRAYRTKAINFYVDNSVTNEQRNQHHGDSKGFSKINSYSAVNSTFFQEDNKINRKEKYSMYSNSTLRDPSQVRHLEESFRKQVGPQFGFDLSKIHKHYQHRRQLRVKLPLLSNNRMIPLSAEHLYGVHTNVISFAKYGEGEILLISTNFNEAAIDMHYNLNPLKILFKNPTKSDLTVKIQDALNQKKFNEEYYTVDELLSSKIQEHIGAYGSSLWRLTILQSEEATKKAYKCSEQRIRDRIQSKPAKWIYSSVFTNELDRLIKESKTLKPFATGLSLLYEEFLAPHNLDFSLIISKTHPFYTNKVKLQKLFGILKLLLTNENKPHFELFKPALKRQIEQLVKGNELGPIAFVTPEIGVWSSVGGLGVMVDELSKELVKLGEKVYIVTPYYEYNKKRETNYLAKDGFVYERNIEVQVAHFNHQFGIHRGTYQGVEYVWFHNPDLFSRPYEGEGAFFVAKQLVFFALASLQSFCQLKIFPSIIVTNDWMCGFVSAYVKVHKYKDIFNGTRFIHICHNLDSTYEGRIYPKVEEGDLNWLVQLPREWYVQYENNKVIINPSRCALQTCDNWGTVSNSYKIDLLRESTLASILWKYPHPFSFPNGVRKDERLSIINAKTPGNHLESKALLQKKYFGLEKVNDSLPLFAFIGRVTKQKGVHLIIDAVEALLYETQFKIQFLIGGPSDSKEEYGKYCADRMKYLTHKYPQCVWSNPDAFFTDGALVNIGSDYSMMPSLFEPGGIVQHEFFSGSTPVVAFRTGGLKDTVFEFDPKTKKGNGFNFMSYDVEDFKRCMRRAIATYKNKEDYAKMRENAFDSVVEESDVARGWNSEFYRMQNKIYIDWDRVDQEIDSFKSKKQTEVMEEGPHVLSLVKGECWKKDWETKRGFKEVLKGASRLEGKLCPFCFETEKIPRPKEVLITGTWDDWKQPTKMNFDKIHKNWKISLKLKPGNYLYKYVADGEWSLTKNEDKETDINNNDNHVIVVE